MSASAILFACIAIGITWGGFGVCLAIATRKQ
jgi:hypothetical protein